MPRKRAERAQKKKKSPSKQCQRETAINLVSKFLTGFTLQFFISQIMLSATKKKGHRYSEELKTFSLSIFHASPKAYRLFRKVFTLPCDSIPSALKMKAGSMSEIGRYCSIVFDEMAIKEFLQYDPNIVMTSLLLASLEELLAVCCQRKREERLAVLQRVISAWQRNAEVFICTHEEMYANDDEQDIDLQRMRAVAEA
ncbi:hypothetical protein CAPTEDRAFT_216352, partial [Capitella teleta]